MRKETWDRGDMDVTVLEKEWTGTGCWDIMIPESTRKEHWDKGDTDTDCSDDGTMSRKPENK